MEPINLATRCSPTRNFNLFGGHLRSPFLVSSFTSNPRLLLKLWTHSKCSPVRWKVRVRFIQTGQNMLYVSRNSSWAKRRISARHVLHFAGDTPKIKKIHGDVSLRPETQSTISTMAEISGSDSSWGHKVTHNTARNEKKQWKSPLSLSKETEKRTCI